MVPTETTEGSLANKNLYATEPTITEGSLLFETTHGITRYRSTAVLIVYAFYRLL